MRRPLSSAFRWRVFCVWPPTKSCPDEPSTANGDFFARHWPTGSAERAERPSCCRRSARWRMMNHCRRFAGAFTLIADGRKQNLARQLLAKTMRSFKDYYRNIYRTFGYPLTARTGVSSAILDAAEKRFGTKLPLALRDFYLVAGNERRFNSSLNRVLAPKDWFVDQRRLAFMEENQAVVFWGVSVRGRPAGPNLFPGR